MTETTTNNELAILIKTSITQMNTRFDGLSSEIDSKIDSLSKSIDSRILRIDTKFDTVTEDLSFKLQNAQMVIEQQTREIHEHDRILHLSDGIFFGIPFKVNENVNSIFLSICRKINFEMDQYNVVSIHRQNSYKKNQSSPIFVKFLSPAVRTHFFSCYLANLSLNLSDIGFETDQRIYFYESISKFAQTLFRKAIDLKKKI